MKYIAWLELRETIKAVAQGIGSCVIRVVLFFFRLTKFVLFFLCNIAIAIFGIAILPGCYFAYRVIVELIHGTPFMQTEYVGFFLLFFCIPVVLLVIRAIVKP